MELIAITLITAIIAKKAIEAATSNKKEAQTEEDEHLFI